MEPSSTSPKATADYVPGVLSKELLIPTVHPGAHYLGPLGNADPIEFIEKETKQIPFSASTINPDAWVTTFRNWPDIPVGWRNWFRRIQSKKADFWDENYMQQCITLSLSEMKRNDAMLIAASYFWSNSANAFIFGHGPMTPTLADIFMLTGLRITGSTNPYNFIKAGERRLGKLDDFPTWPRYIAKHDKGTGPVEQREHIAFLNMWLEKFLFCGRANRPDFSNQYLAECLSEYNQIQLGKFLLGSFYNLMNKVSAKLLLGQVIDTITGPWWLLQIWLNLYMFKFVRPDLRNLKFPSTLYAEEERETAEKYRGCFNYGEAASDIVINFSKGKFFKVLYKGFDIDHLVWLPYLEADDNNLVFPIQFRFSQGCVDEVAISIFNCFIRPCALPVDFFYCKEKIDKHRDYLSTYEFYNPSFVARQFGLGQLPPTLHFSNVLRPREGITCSSEARRIFRSLGLDLPSYAASDWEPTIFSSSLYDQWWQEWHSHIFCKSADLLSQVLDVNYVSEGQDSPTNPPAVDRRGKAIHYDITGPKSRLGFGPKLKSFMATPMDPVILSGTKRKATGSNVKVTTSLKKSKVTTRDGSSSGKHGLTTEEQEPNTAEGTPDLPHDDAKEASADIHGRDDEDGDNDPENIVEDSQDVHSGQSIGNLVDLTGDQEAEETPVLEEDENEAEEDTHGRKDGDGDEHPDELESDSHYLHSGDYGDSLVHLSDEQNKDSEPTEHNTGIENVLEISSDHDDGSASGSQSKNARSGQYHEGIKAQSQLVNAAGFSPSPNEGKQISVVPSVEQTNATELSHRSTVKDVGTSAVLPEAQKGSKSLSLGYSFDYTMFIDEDEVSSLLSVGGSVEDVKHRLKEVFPLLGSLSDFVQNAEFIGKAIMDIQGRLPQNLLSLIMPVVEIEDQIPRIRRAERNLTQKSGLLDKKNRNKQKAHDLHFTLNDLRKKSSELKPELDNLYARKSQLEKELEDVNVAIRYTESVLDPVSSSMEKKKEEMRMTVAEGHLISKELKTISDLSSGDEDLMAGIESVRCVALDAIKNFLSE